MQGGIVTNLGAVLLPKDATQEILINLLKEEIGDSFDPTNDIIYYTTMNSTGTKHATTQLLTNPQQENKMRWFDKFVAVLVE